MEEVTLQLGESSLPQLCTNHRSSTKETKRSPGRDRLPLPAVESKSVFDPAIITLDQIERAIEKTGYKVQARS
jgi:copper chaperone CopZ